jgi:cell division protein FtsN
MADNDDEGMSTKTKVVAGAALGIAVPAAVGAARKLLGGDEQDGKNDEHEEREQQPQQERQQPQRKQRTARTARKSRSQSGASRSSSSKSNATPAKKKTARTRTKEQLYRTATRLKIEGRSSMSKDELEKAVNRAKK